MKRGSYQVHLLPKLNFETMDYSEPAGFTAQVLYMDPTSGRELPVFWKEFGPEISEEELGEGIVAELRERKADPGDIEVVSHEMRMPPKAAYWPKDVKPWKWERCKRRDDPRFDLYIFMPLEPEGPREWTPRGSGAELTKEEAYHSLRDTDLETIDRALNASVDFQILFGFQVNGAGTGFGYRDMIYYNVTKKEADEMRPLAEEILTQMGYRLGRGKGRARVEVHPRRCKD